MKKEEILEKISRRISDGSLLTIKSMANGGNYFSAYRKAAAGEFKPTANKSIFARDESAADEFNRLHDAGYVMSVKEIMDRYPEIGGKRHVLDSMCALGKFLKARINGTVLYIIGED